MKPNIATGEEWLSARLELPEAEKDLVRMALLAGVFGGASGMHSSGTHGSYGLVDGTALMYLLMSAFHAAPWQVRRAYPPAGAASLSGAE